MTKYTQDIYKISRYVNDYDGYNGDYFKHYKNINSSQILRPTYKDIEDFIVFCIEHDKNKFDIRKIKKQEWFNNIGIQDRFQTMKVYYWTKLDANNKEEAFRIIKNNLEDFLSQLSPNNSVEEK